MNRTRARALAALGWLLTPIVAGAASFVGAWLGAWLSPVIPPAGTGMVEMVGGGVISVVVATTFWLRGLRRLGGSPRPPRPDPPAAAPSSEADAAPTPGDGA